MVGALRQHLGKLIGLAFLSLSAVYGKHALVTRRSTSSRAKQLAALALDKLAVQAALHTDDPLAYPEPWLGMPALRDDVLRDEFSASQRAKVWVVVKGLVEGNANVRPSVREGRTGDVGRVWEWIGAVARIDSPDSGRRGSRRFSLSATNVARTSDARLLVGEERTPEMKEGNVTRWKEGDGAYY